MKRFVLYILFGSVSLIVIAAFAFAVFQPIKVLPRIRLAPGFSMINQAGEQVTNEDLRGRLVLYNFSYAACGDDCQGGDQTMLKVQESLRTLPLNVPVRLVTISIDTQNDDAEALLEYATRTDADVRLWDFMTTTDEKLLKTIVGSGFEVFYALQEDGSFRLDNAFILVDGWGIIRGEYRYPTGMADDERILRHIKVLSDEVVKSKGAARLAYEAAHIFLCYAP